MTCTAEGINIFSAAPGTVVVIEGDAIPVTFAVDGQTGLFNDLKAIVTSVGLQAQGGFQFTHAMREFIYLYVFTERVGIINVNGLAFPQSCGPLGPQDDQIFSPEGTQCAINGDTGFERVVQWYECNRITSRAEAINITFGVDLTYEAFLVACKAEIANPDTNIAQFSMQFHFIPNIVSDDDLCFPFDEDCLDAPCGE